MYVVVEENYAGYYVSGKRGGDEVYTHRVEALRARDADQKAADGAGVPSVFRAYELREIEEW